MAGLSNDAEVMVLNALLRNQTLQVANPHIALHTSDPTDTANPTELTDSGYARMPGTFDAPSNGPGNTQNSADITFNAIVDPGPYQITHISVWDGASGGTMLLSQALNTAKTFSQGDVPRFPTGAFVVTAS